jgi:hypothetical protein
LTYADIVSVTGWTQVFEFGCSGQCYTWGANPDKWKKANNGKKQKSTRWNVREESANLKKEYNKRL